MKFIEWHCEVMKEDDEFIIRKKCVNHMKKLASSVSIENLPPYKNWRTTLVRAYLAFLDRILYDRS